MLFFKKKKSSDRSKEDRDLIQSNSQSIDALIILAKDRASLISDLKALQEKLKYLIPSDQAKIIDYDKTIRNKLGDLRIALTKSDDELSKKVSNILTEIQLAIADRNARM